MTVDRPLHVLIAGAGLSGLALAQGLLKSGHTVDVYERDADLNRKQGYYLHFNGIGGNALQRCLPDDLYELYLDTSRESYDRAESIVLTPGLTEITSQPHMGPPNTGPRNHTGVHRRTLRQILCGRLGDSLHVGNAVTSFEQDEDGVTIHLADGTTARGDVLVGADGIRSAVRTQLLPEVPVIPTGIQGIGVFGRTPITPELDAVLPDILNQGVLMAVDRSGSRLLIGSFRPRRGASEAAAERAPDVTVDDVAPYIMVSCSVERGFEVPPGGEWTEGTARSVRDSQLRAIEGWHPAAQAIVEGQELGSMFMIPFGFLEPAEDWKPSRVTIVGDAAHGMLPTLGMGANLSLNDSALLLDQLDRVGRAEIDIPSALGAYEAQMRETSYPILRMTLQHDENFGGGGLKDQGSGGPDHGVSSRLAGKSVLVTGTGGGIGRATAVLCAREGAHVVGCDLNPGPSEETVALVRAAGGTMDAMAPVDLSTEDGARRWVDEAAATAGGVDVLVNNASSIRFGAIDELSYADWSYTMRNELDIVFLVTRAAWQHLVARGGGSIVNIGSISGSRGAWFMPQNAHGAAKGGVLALTRQLVIEGGPHGIRVNAVSPAMTETPHTSPLLLGEESPADQILSRVPLRKWGQPEDVANAILFLASDESSHISGADIPVDGGAAVVG